MLSCLSLLSIGNDRFAAANGGFRAVCKFDLTD
jgi:hypothetical protein